MEPNLLERSSETWDVELRERHVAGLAPAVPGGLGRVQPAVLRGPEPLLPELAVPLQRLQPVVVRQPGEPAPAQLPVPVPVPVPEAPAEEVPALLAVLLAEPVAVPQLPPPVPGEALRLLQEALPVSVPLAGPVPQPVPLSGTVVLPEGLCGHAGATLLRLRPHRVPGGSRELAGKVQIQVEVAEPHAFSLK